MATNTYNTFQAELSRPLSGDPPPISDQPAENAQPTARGRSAATLRAEPPKAVQAQRDTGRLEGRTKTEGNREGVASTEAKDLAIVPFDPRIELEDEEQDGQLSSQETKRNWNTGTCLKQFSTRALGIPESLWI